MDAITLLANATIFTGDAFVEGHGLLISNGRIIDIVRKPPIGEHNIIDYHDNIICAGFIDLQVNGGGGKLIGATTTVEDLLHISATHARNGTLHFLPTLISDSLQTTKHIIEVVNEAKELCANISGLHLEGPHLAKSRCGIHSASLLRPPSTEDISLYKAAAKNYPLLLTIAPEVFPMPSISALAAEGICINIGHSEAVAELVNDAANAGARGVTHLFNAMPPPLAREPSVVGAALANDNLWCSVIADGHHVDPYMIRVAYNAKPLNKLMLVSDAMPPAGCVNIDNRDNKKHRHNTLSFTMHGIDISSANGRCFSPEGRLAGSAMTLGECVHYCIASLGLPPEHVLRMATLNPSEYLGIDKEIGRLLPGYPADIVIMDKRFTVVDVWKSIQPTDAPKL